MGLQPYPIRNPSIRRQFPEGTEGIFTWVNRLTGLSHHGQCLWVMIHHHTLSVVLLSYEYEREDYRDKDGLFPLVRHDGEFSTNYNEPWVYHKGEPAVLLNSTVPIERITLEAVYNFQDFMDKEDQGVLCLTSCSR